MITRKLFLVVIAGLMLATTSLFAGPFYDDNFVISTKKTDYICTHFGDGYQSYIEDPNGFVVIWSTDSQAYVYAVKDANGYLVPSTVPIGGSPPAGKHLRISGTALTNYNQQIANWSTSLDDTPTVDDDHLFVILVDFLDQSTSSYNGGTYDIGSAKYYEVELMYNSFFAEGYIGQNDAYGLNPSDKENTPNVIFDVYGSVRQYFREISYYSSPMYDTPSLIRDDYDMAPQSNNSSLDNFFTTVPLDEREMYFVPGFLNPVVYDDVARQWHFLYYNLGATIYDPEINDYVDATAENVQNIIKGQAAIAGVIDNALLQARTYGFDIDLADIGYDQDEENKIHMVYAEDNEGWGFHNYGRYSWAQEEKKFQVPGYQEEQLVYDHIYYHAREIGQNIFKLADTGHNHYKWDGSTTDLYAHFNWGIGPYDIMNGHLFAYNDGGSLTALEKFNAHATPPHPSPANKVLKDMVEPTILSNVDNTYNVTPYATTGNVYLIEDPNHPVSSANNYSDAEYLLVCNRSFPCDGSFAATDSSFENFWEKYFRGLDIYHVDWSDNDPDRRKAYQAELDHREIQNVLLDNNEGDGSTTLQYFHYFDEDLWDVFFDMDFGSNPWSRDWNEDGQNGGGPSFINLMEVIDNTTYFSFDLDALMSNPCIHPELVVPTVIGGVEDPNFYLGTTLPYKSYEFWVNNYSYISSPTFTVTVAPENASIVEVDDNTDQHTFVGPLQADGSDSFTPFNMRMISDTESLIGSEVTLDVTYSPDYPLNVDEINIPVSYPITDGYPQVLSNDQACRGNLIAFDLDNDGADEFIGFSHKDLMVFRGSSRFSETVSTSAIYRGVAVGNILPDDTQVLGGEPGSGVVEYQPEILVLYWDYLNSRTTIKLYSFDPSSGLDLLYTYHETGTTGPLSQPVLGNIYSNGLHDLVYCVENSTNGSVRARRFDGSTMEEIWTYSPENGYLEVGQGKKPLVADFDLDGLKEVAVCLYSKGSSNEFLGDGYRVIRTNGLATNGYTEIPVEVISSSSEDATKGYRTTGVAADFDMDDTLEIAVQWGEWGSQDPVHTSSKIGVLDFNGESFDLHTTTSNYAFNGEMMVADITVTDGPEILAGIGWYADPSLTPDNEIISFRYTSSHTIQENSYWDWENETGTPFSMIAGAFPSSNDGRPHVAGIVSGEEGEYSQIHIMASDGNPAFGNSSTNSTLNAKGSEVVYESGYNPNAAIACSDNESNNQSLMVWTDRMVYKYSDNSASQVAGLSYWPMKYHDAQNSSVYDTVAVPDSIVFANGTTLEGSLYFKGDATVSEGDTVYILPGTRIHMMSIDPDDRFHVYGTLMAEGTLEDAISFISGHVDTTGGILFHDTCLPNSKLQHIEFNDFKYALEFDGYVETALSREINNLDFTNCQYGLYANSSSIVAYNIEFADCYNSIKAIETHVIIDTCNIVDPGVYGIYLQGNSSGATNTYSYLYNVEIDGEGATSCFATIYAFYLTQCVIEDLRIEDAYIHGIYTGYSSGVIRDSFILSSGNTGLVCFNSGIDLDGVVINDSEQYGILTYGTSSPVLDDCAIVNNDNVQYYSTSGSLPVIDDRHNDIYRETGNTNYLIKNNGSPLASIYYCENNYWGPSTPTSSLFSINRLGIDYNPWDTTPNVPTISTAETDTFMLACDAELDGDWDLAKERFQWIIQNSNDDAQRMDALSHWVNLGSTNIDTWEEKENQLNSWESTAVIGTEFYNSLEDAMARCYVGQKRHYDAIEIYSNRYHNATTFSDSALAEIHINNIYVDMAYSFNGDGGRSTSNADVSIEDREELKPQLGSIRAVHNTNKLKPSSLTKAEERVHKLMELIALGKREDSSLLPKEFKLASPYPNPFNPTVAIPFEIPKQAEITIAVYNVLGQRVSTLISKPMNAGYHKILWNGKDQYGTPIASGVYFVKMSAPNYIKTRKIVMLK